MSDNEPSGRSGPSVPSSGRIVRKPARKRAPKSAATASSPPVSPAKAPPPENRHHIPETGGHREPPPHPVAEAAAAADAARKAERSSRAGSRTDAATARGEPRIESAGTWDKPGMVNAKLIYSIYLVAPALPIAALLGFGLAYWAQRRQPPAWLHSHYTYQIRTFWGIAAGYLATVLLAFAGGNVIIYPLVAVWLVARAVHGVVRAARAEPIDDPDAFLV